LLSKLFSFFKSQKYTHFSKFDPKRKEKIYERINELVGFVPQEDKYFIKAFTHRSYLDKARVDIKSNERLEFLGDSILGKIVAEYLFKKYPQKEEGYLTKARSHLVNKHSLEKIAFDLKLQELLFVNDDFLIKDTKKLSNIVADCLEALIAAIYLDMGEEIATKFVIKCIIKPQVLNGNINYDKNYKGQLLEYAHANKLNQPVYKIIDQLGPQHEKIYTVEVNIDEYIRGTGKGPNKKIAEQNAAKSALSAALQKK